MPRKQFISDVQVAADKNVLGITNVARGDDDGEVVACFVPPSGAPIEISLMAQPGTSVIPLLISYLAASICLLHF
jgi:ubiquitin-conjugating enzyme E2 Q